VDVQRIFVSAGKEWERVVDAGCVVEGSLRTMLEMVVGVKEEKEKRKERKMCLGEKEMKHEAEMGGDGDRYEDGHEDGHSSKRRRMTKGSEG
jgi:phosphopantothenoylcysteine synthetase/decarboxylase